MHQRSKAALATVVLLLVIGCSGNADQTVAAGHSPSTMIPPQEHQVASPFREITQPEQFRFRRARIDPLPAGAVGILPAERVFGTVRNLRTTDFEMFLGSFTDLDMEMRQPDGTVKPIFVGRPAWVLLERNLIEDSGGRPDGPKGTYRADRFTVFDAMTGEELFAFDGPTGGSMCPIGKDAPPDRCANTPIADAPTTGD